MWKGDLSQEKNIPMISLHDMAHTKDICGASIHNISPRNKDFGGNLDWHMYKLLKRNSAKCPNRNISVVMITIFDPPKGWIV